MFAAWQRHRFGDNKQQRC